MLEVERIRVSYGAAPAISEASIRIGPGELACVIGPNGAGKTTLINAIAGLHSIEAGALRLVLLDEPSLGLAPAVVLAVFDVIKRINAGGVAVLLVEQNAALALEIAVRAYVLEEGRIAAEGSPEALLAQPHIRRAYLG